MWKRYAFFLLNYSKLVLIVVISDILFGQVNPSGRLAMTFPVSTEQCPTYKSFQDDSQGLIYEEESLFGYRSYQQMGIKPAYREYPLRLTMRSVLKRQLSDSVNRILLSNGQARISQTPAMVSL